MCKLVQIKNINYISINILYLISFFFLYFEKISCYKIFLKFILCLGDFHSKSILNFSFNKLKIKKIFT